jgi:hypothetical protein
MSSKSFDYVYFAGILIPSEMWRRLNPDEDHAAAQFHGRLNPVTGYPFPDYGIPSQV